METLDTRNTSPVTATPQAIVKISELMASQGDYPADEVLLRIEVRPGGCSGFTYQLYFEGPQEGGAGDPVYTLEAGEAEVRIVIDSESANMLVGSTLHYEEGLMGAGFRIDNPNVSRTCGCGKSFC